MGVTPDVLPIAIGLYEVTLTFATVCIIFIIASKLYRKAFNKRFDVNIERGIKYVEAGSVLGTLSGTFLLAISTYLVLDFLIQFHALVNSPLIMNKVMMLIFALEFWVIFLVVRIIYGREVWNRGALSIVCVAIGLAGFFSTVETGSLGTHLFGQGSVLDPLYTSLDGLLGVNPEHFFALGTVGTYTLIGICLLAAILFTYIHRKPKAH